MTIPGRPVGAGALLADGGPEKHEVEGGEEESVLADLRGVLQTASP